MAIRPPRSLAAGNAIGDPVYVRLKCSGSELWRRIRQTEMLALAGQLAPVRCRDRGLLIVGSGSVSHVRERTRVHA